MDRMNSVINSTNTHEAHSICNLIISEINTQFFLSFSTKSIKPKRQFTLQWEDWFFSLFVFNLIWWKLSNTVFRGVQQGFLIARELEHADRLSSGVSYCWGDGHTWELLLGACALFLSSPEAGGRSGDSPWQGAVGALRFPASLSPAHDSLCSLIQPCQFLEVLWLFLAAEVVLAQGAKIQVPARGC